MQCKRSSRVLLKQQSIMSSPISMSLPWKRHSNVGFTVSTKIKTSLIEGAGFGRFTEDEIKPGTIIRSDKLLNVAEAKIQTTENPNSSFAISLKTETDVESVEDWLVAWCAVTDRTKVIVGMSDFIGGSVKSDTDNGIPISCLLFPSLHMNHAKNPNIKQIIRGGRLVLEAKCTIAPGEELLLDYNDLYYNPGVRAWLKKHKKLSATEKVFVAIEASTMTSVGDAT